MAIPGTIGSSHKATTKKTTKVVFFFFYDSYFYFSAIKFTIYGQVPENNLRVI